MDYIRDYAMYASIFGMFSFVWFGWAQERPRNQWRVYLGIASGIALLVCLFGVYLSIKNWGEASTLKEGTSYTTYLITVCIEFALAGLGAFLLIRKKRNDFVAPWIAFIVGIHFIGLVGVFDDPSLYILSALMVAVSIIAIYLAPKLQVARSAITGIGSGTILFGFAILGLIRFFSV